MTKVIDFQKNVKYNLHKGAGARRYVWSHFKGGYLSKSNSSFNASIHASKYLSNLLHFNYNGTYSFVTPLQRQLSSVQGSNPDDIKSFIQNDPTYFSYSFSLFNQLLQFYNKSSTENVHPVYGGGVRIHKLLITCLLP